MNCRKVRVLYTLFRDKSLNVQQTKEVSEHIKMCEQCKDLYDELDRITSYAKTFERVKPNPESLENILRTIEIAPQKRWFIKPHWVIAYGTIFVLLIGFSFSLIHRMNVKKQLIAKKQEEELLKHNKKYIMDYGEFQKGKPIYTIPSNGHSVKVMETSY